MLYFQDLNITTPCMCRISFDVVNAFTRVHIATTFTLTNVIRVLMILYVSFKILKIAQYINRAILRMYYFN